MTWPTDNQGSAVAALPGFTLSPLEGCDAAVGEADRFGTVVGGEDHDRVIELAHVFQLLENDADVVVQLLHTGFVDAPVLSSFYAKHSFILRREHGYDVHTRRIIPSEERLVGFLRVVTIEEVDDLGRDFLVHRFRALKRQRALVLARLVLLRAVRGLTRNDGARRHQAERRFLVYSTGRVGEARHRRIFAWRRDVLHGRRRIDIREADLLHRVEMIKITPVFLEAMRGRKRRRMVAEVVFAKLAGVVTEVEKELGKRRCAGLQI